MIQPAKGHGGVSIISSLYAIPKGKCCSGCGGDSGPAGEIVYEDGTEVFICWGCESAGGDTRRAALIRRVRAALPRGCLLDTDEEMNQKETWGTGSVWYRITCGCGSRLAPFLVGEFAKEDWVYVGLGELTLHRAEVAHLEA